MYALLIQSSTARFTRIESSQSFSVYFIETNIDYSNSLSPLGLLSNTVDAYTQFLGIQFILL